MVKNLDQAKKEIPIKMKKIFVLALSFISLFLLESCPDLRIMRAFVYFYLTSPPFSFEKITVHINSLSVRDSSGNRITGSVNRTMTLDPELIPYTTVGRTIYPDQDFKDRVRKPGYYSGDQMVIDSGQVTVGGVTYSLQIPNPVVDVTGGFLVEAELNNYIDFIIDVDRSILADGLGGFILKPIIQVRKQGS